MTGLGERLERVVGKKSADALEGAFKLATAGDLLRHYPRRYAERGQLTDIAGLEVGEHVTVMAKVVSVTKRQMKTKRGTLVEVALTDGKRSLDCAFFNQPWHMEKLKPGMSALFAGKVTAFRQKLQLANPDYQLLDGDAETEAVEEFAGGLIPVYPSSAKIQSWQIAQCVQQALAVLDEITDPFPDALRDKLGLPPYEQAVRSIHRPAEWADLELARTRLKWDEALSVQLALAQRRQAANARPAPACPPTEGAILSAFDKRLPFTLTAGQVEVGEAIAADLSGEHPMNRLLQGEVGSGKTIVALRAMLQAVDSGKQAAMLAPTEVLAAQHARSLRELLGELGQGGELGAADNATKVTLLTGSLTAPQRKQAMLDAVSGAAGIVVGTHALIQDKVRFAALGLVVVDEQHRFGVEQRDALRGRAGENLSPHVLVMTATPIPRTVAMTVYGDLEISALRELPAGRSPISTTVVPVAEKPSWLDRVWQRVREEVGKGHQAYVVCPRIGDEEDGPGGSDDGRRPPLAVVEVTETLAAGPLSGLRLGILHGRLPTDEKDAVMRAFAAAEIDVLVATTVVEVGVNVPNATAMVIMDADRFGVSQLHQLRGRVGRGSAPGVCLLVTDMPGGTATRDRLDAVASTLDGFELARMDLELRREGDILGASQSGAKSGLKMLSLIRDEQVIADARVVAQALVADDPALTAYPGLAGMVHQVIDTERAEYLEKA
ncbi:ATP-dependent DNA helicase RecG [Actinokineospora globicatena]|uniref:ATP-dependent DNA helicase RecG n=1 Tax=Actinokineospora globicatena TaxID=103729 RepID=UPI0020A56138|nr:ATP-dependent DNA helicase RecG [Actinokineospora globicatena]MCP2305533.1 ATP-dependent DNA helicase RecG [Actinokineospora globicatena]GLW81401.1 ATP-dependent DNA helicase RecG [Actinokineospora globicatena]GLW87901.1 ATP-dependent DNA helicase RecG [Actinokineospora globicatena]